MLAYLRYKTIKIRFNQTPTPIVSTFSSLVLLILRLCIITPENKVGYCRPNHTLFKKKKTRSINRIKSHTSKYSSRFYIHSLFCWLNENICNFCSILWLNLKSFTHICQQMSPEGCFQKAQSFFRSSTDSVLPITKMNTLANT